MLGEPLEWDFTNPQYEQNFQEYINYWNYITAQPQPVKAEFTKEKVAQKLHKGGASSKMVDDVNFLIQTMYIVNSVNPLTIIKIGKKLMNSSDYQRLFQMRSNIDYYKKRCAAAANIYQLNIMEHDYYKLCTLLHNRQFNDSLFTDIETSTKMMIRWFKNAAQANSNHKLKTDQDMFHSFWMVANKMDQKVNTLYVHGKPNSGKTKTIEFLISGFNSIGRPASQIAYFWGCAANAQCVMIDEFLMSSDPVFVNKTKEILAGQPTNVTKKYHADIPVDRVPVFIASNYQDFPNLKTVDKTALNKRMIYWTNLQEIPNADKYEKPLHPKTLLKLAEHYKTDIDIKKIKHLFNCA